MFANFLEYNFYLILVACSHLFFFMPSKIASGGLISLAMIIFSIFQLNLILNYRSGVAILAFLLNIPLLFFSRIILSKTYVLKTMYGVVMLPVFTALLGYFLELFNFDYIFSPFYSILFGSLIMGFGIAKLHILGGSSGGVDIIGKIINYVFPIIAVGNAISFVRILIISLTAVAFGIENFVYSILVAMSSGFIIDFFMARFR